MRRDSKHVPNHRVHAARPETLPPSFEPDLQAVDARVAEHARRVTDLPVGLTDRVFEASAPGLPAVRPSERAIPRWRPRLVSSGDRGRRRWIPTAAGWSRLGLAAALMFAAVLVTVFSRPRPASEPEAALAGAIDWLDADPLEATDRRVSHLLDTGGLSSIDEVTGELESMIAALEM